jgi:hypothetical protein
MTTPNRTRPWRYDATGQLIPPLPPQPKKQRPGKAAPTTRNRSADLTELDQRSKQKRVAELDTLEARQALTMLQTIVASGPTAGRIEQLFDLLHYLKKQRTSLRNRFVELTRYEARTETNDDLAGVMLAAAQVIDDYKRARKVAA